MTYDDIIGDYLRRAYVRDALKRLSEPSLGEVLNRKRWRIVRITERGFDVVRLEEKRASAAGS